MLYLEADELEKKFNLDKEEIENLSFIIESYANASLYKALKPFSKKDDFYEGYFHFIL